MARGTNQKQGLRAVPPRERLPFLSVLAWLSGRDRKIAAAERAFLRAAARELRLPPAAVSSALTSARWPSPERMVRGLRTEWVKRVLLHRLLLLALCDGDYDARERAGLFKLASLMGVPEADVEQLEAGVAADLESAASVHEGAASAKRLVASGWPWRRIGVVGGVTVGAAALLVVTGGMAAPAIGGAIGSTFMGLSGAAATSAGLAFLGGGAMAAGGFGMAGGTVAVAGALGLAGGGLAATKVTKRTGDLSEFGFVPLGGKGAHVLVAVSGFLSQRADFVNDWSVLTEVFPRSQAFALQWESKALLDLGRSIGAAGVKAGLGLAARAAARHASRLAAEAVALPAALLGALGIIDNPWHVASDRAEKAGRALAQCLRDRAWGARPVTLVGFSLGTRVIAEALRDLGSDASGFVHHAILLGGAIPLDAPVIVSAPSLVAGSVVNGFCDSDWVLALLFRAAEWRRPIGLGEINRDGVINVDLSSVVTGHLAYRPELKQVLQRVRAALSRK